MDRMIFTAMNGAKQSFDQQAVAAHNLSNISTPGFRAQLSSMQSIEIQGDGHKTRTLPLASTPGSDFSSGPIQMTGRALDVAIRGQGLFAVMDADGTESYTRRGDMQQDQNGMLFLAGKPVMGEDGPLVLPLDSEISIGANGTISAIEAGQGPQGIAEVGRIKVVAADQAALERGDDGFFRALPGEDGLRAPLLANDNVQVVGGALEGSNVSPTEAMVAMINTARRYEMQMKVISTADENAQRANNLLSMS